MNRAANLKSPIGRTKSDLVAERIRQRILSGGLVPGQRLVLRVFAEEFSCSEIPVREAFRSLEAAGLVDIVPHSGARVAPFDPKLVAELTQVRALLEPAATCAAAPHLTAGDLAEIAGLIERMERCAASGDAAGYGSLNRAFHDTILRRCPNRRLVTLISDLWDEAERGRIVYQRDPDHMRVSSAHHRRIFRAIEAGDGEELAAAMREHSGFAVASVRELAELDAGEAAEMPEWGE